jgi:glyoxylase-like metal-dependent hydrolase (beta-lactamase superfamily II)
MAIMGSKDQNAPLQTFIHSASDEGLSSITSLIVGSKNAVLIDPPHLIADGRSVVKWIKETTTLPLKAIFVTHHHPDHFYSADIILDAFPAAQLYAAPYVRAGIDREYDDKVVYWNEMLPGKMVERPRKPDPYPFSFFVIDGNPESPIMLLGPVQGDTVDHTLFWLPREKTIICGDAVYARSTHVWSVSTTRSSQTTN